MGGAAIWNRVIDFQKADKAACGPGNRETAFRSPGSNLLCFSRCIICLSQATQQTRGGSSEFIFVWNAWHRLNDFKTRWSIPKIHMTAFKSR